MGRARRRQPDEHDRVQAGAWQRVVLCIFPTILVQSLRHMACGIAFEQICSRAAGPRRIPLKQLQPFHGPSLISDGHIHAVSFAVDFGTIVTDFVTSKIVAASPATEERFAYCLPFRLESICVHVIHVGKKGMFDSGTQLNGK